MKKNLSDNIYENITYKDIRDTFKDISFGRFNLEYFTANLFFKEVKAETKDLPISLELRTKMNLYHMINRQLLGDIEVYEPEMLDRVEKSKLIINSLLNDGLISKMDDEDFFEITEDGHSLRMQKALKRIPLKRAEALMVKMLKSVEAYNKDPDAPYSINQIYLFGSVQRKEKDAGDIDIAISYNQKRLPNESYEEYSKRICEAHNINSWDFVDGKLRGQVYKTLNVSPYVSTTYTSDLKGLMEKGADAMLLFSTNETAQEINVDKYEFTTIKRENDFSLTA